MPQETLNPQSFAEMITSPAYPTWAKPEPPDNPVKHRRTYTFLRAMANTWDQLVTAFQSAAYCHGSQTAPADALNPLGETYGGLGRAIIDTDDTYRAYLKNPLSRWNKFGTKLGMAGELAHLGYPNSQVVSWRNLVDAGAGPGSVVFGGRVNFFFVALFAPNPLQSVAPTRWLQSGSHWGAGDGWWGGNPNSNNYVAELTRVIQLCKPAHTSCRFVVAFLDSTSGLDAQLMPTGNYAIYPMNEGWERIRPSYALNPYYIYSPLVR